MKLPLSKVIGETLLWLYVILMFGFWVPGVLYIYMSRYLFLLAGVIAFLVKNGMLTFGKEPDPNC